MPELRWIKSRRSLLQWDPRCIEAATLPNGDIAIRDSKNPRGAILTLPRAVAFAFIRAAADDNLTK